MGTMSKTKSTNRIYAGKELIDELVKEERKKRAREALRSFYELKKQFDQVMKKIEWVKIKNQPVYYIEKYRMIIADPARMECPVNSFDGKIAKYQGRRLQRREAEDLFLYNCRNNPLLTNGAYFHIKNRGDNKYYYVLHDENKTAYIGYSSNYGTQNTYVGIPVYEFEKGISTLELLIRERLIPEGLNGQGEKQFETLAALYRKGVATFTVKGDVRLTDQWMEWILSGNYEELNGISFKEADVIEHIKTSKIALTEGIRNAIQETYLNCDYLRAEIDPYDPNLLEDVERGHWELWEEEREGVPLELEERLVGRNPLADIQEDGIVGIDFGTKSTVVMYQNGSDLIRPMRVGRGQYKKEVRKEDYENPTVMEFRDLEQFLSRYGQKKGRPDTLWEDLTVSHKAAEQLKSENDSSKFYSFFGDLKQWCGDKNRRIRLVDNKGHEEELPAFLEIGEDGWDPIELYAYYLGLYINNMRQKIYLNYLLSFPVTYEKAVKEKLIQSFEKGIRKALPVTVLDEEDCMKRLSIRQWSSEPAAYAVCALTEYRFDPAEGEKIFYGIFDFGGGTTDFDFGIWETSKSRRYDYTIRHFGAGGDQYLGGEHLLEMMAFHVFRENKRALLEQDIPFYRPHDCDDFAGSEDLLYDSQEARLNIRQLMEKLRALWQNDSDEAIKAIETGKLRVLLFTKSGKPEPNLELEVDKEELLGLLRGRIEQGVKNFFAAMAETFQKEDLKEARGIHIFLAGNSSKSEIVKELFEQYCRTWTKKIREKFQEELRADEEESFFWVFPPLGTEEALEIQRARGVDMGEKQEDFNRPTGKTGVAYGLIQSRPGSRIQVLSEIKNTDEVKFRYYIGYEKKGRFQTILGRDTEYQKWNYFIDASETDFEFYYTSLPEEALHQSPVLNIRKKLCRIESAREDERIGVYLRAVEPAVLEYAVASEDGLDRGEWIEAPKRVELG